MIRSFDLILECVFDCYAQISGLQTQIYLQNHNNYHVFCECILNLYEMMEAKFFYDFSCIRCFYISCILLYILLKKEKC